MNSWDILSTEEKTNILINWFIACGGRKCTDDDIELFKPIAQTKQEDIFNHIVMLYIHRRTIMSSMVLNALKDNRLELLLSWSLTPNDLDTNSINSYLENRNIVANELTSKFGLSEGKDNPEMGVL